MEEKARLTLKIYGRVQGVFFRAETVRQARSLGLTGWVRNVEDGTVGITAEGERKALTRLYQWCQNGPSFSHVEKIEVKWKPYKSEFTSFEAGY